MDLRKFLSLGIATLMVVAFASSAFAQNVANPPGLWIRVTTPDSGKFAKIEDTVRVNVLTLGNVISTLYVGAVTDTTATAGDILTVAGQTDGRNQPYANSKVMRARSMVAANRSIFSGTSGSSPDGRSHRLGCAVVSISPRFTGPPSSSIRRPVRLWRLPTLSLLKS